MWELLGVFGVFGIWPLTWLVRDSFANGGEWARVFWVIVIAGGAGLLYRHFFVVKQSYDGKDAGTG